MGEPEKQAVLRYPSGLGGLGALLSCLQGDGLEFLVFGIIRVRGYADRPANSKVKVRRITAWRKGIRDVFVFAPVYIG